MIPSTITNQPTRKFPAEFPENTYDADVFLFGRPADCRQHRIRASDINNRHPVTVETVTIKVNSEVPPLESEDSCKCVDCITARINESERNAREIEGAYSREELFEFTKTQSWNTIVYAPNASGKTTARALLRANGIACFDIGAKVDWYCFGPHLRHSIMFCTDPVYLKHAKNPIAIIPSEGERRRRYDFRLRTRPEVRWRANLDFPTSTRIIHSNKMLSDVIQIMHPDAE